MIGLSLNSVYPMDTQLFQHLLLKRFFPCSTEFFRSVCQEAFPCSTESFWSVGQKPTVALFFDSIPGIAKL